MQSKNVHFAKSMHFSPDCPPVRLSLCSHVRECLKLDQDDKECFSHYKLVKKLSKQLDSAEELIQAERSGPQLLLS